MLSRKLTKFDLRLQNSDVTANTDPFSLYFQNLIADVEDSSTEPLPVILTIRGLSGKFPNISRKNFPILP